MNDYIIFFQAIHGLLRFGKNPTGKEGIFKSPLFIKKNISSMNS